MHWPGVEPVTSRSWVQHANHYTTKPPLFYCTVCSMFINSKKRTRVFNPFNFSLLCHAFWYCKMHYFIQVNGLFDLWKPLWVLAETGCEFIVHESEARSIVECARETAEPKTGFGSWQSNRTLVIIMFNSEVSPGVYVSWMVYIYYYYYLVLVLIKNFLID